jgi:2-methylisocitrate lyase-like PEP mutase family enzyme
MASAADRLRQLLARPEILVMPGCFDGLSAKLAEQAGFAAVFMSGFAVAAARLGLPDTGLISYGELLDQGRNICAAVSIPVFGDADTGFGNALNVKRTVRGYAQAGFACVMIEDQVMPKRCGHTEGKAVVSREEAVQRIRAAVDARREGADILLIARTDAAATHGFGEALERARAFAALGADISFVEAPTSEQQMRDYCRSVPGLKMANLIEQGRTPLLTPLSALSAAVRAMQETLLNLRQGLPPQRLLPFETLKQVVGFPEYYAGEARYGRSS